MKKAIEWLLFRADISNYQISKATGISQVVLSKYTNGKSDIGRMTLDNALKLYDYFEHVLRELERKYGSVEFEGKQYILTQDAYLHGTHDQPYYRAHAIDATGNEYYVLWSVVDGWDQMDDASNHCDWQNPVGVVKL